MQQPGPFEEVAWLAQAAGPIPAVLRYLPPVGIEELDELPLLEEVAAEEIVDALRPRQPVRLAARLVEREEGLEQEIGRASCRESVCQYVLISAVADSLKKKEEY